MAKFFKLIAENRKARFDFNIIDTYKAGLVLEGSEVKSIRQGKVNLKESFGRVENGELFIYGMHVSPWKSAGKQAPDPLRPRKALLQKKESVKLIGKVSEKGLTLIPLKIFLDGNWVKMELGLGVAKKKFEKRDKLRRKETEREIERAFKGKTHEH